MPLPTTPPTLQGARLSLRALDPRDVHALFEIHADPDVMRYWSTAPWTEPAQAEALLASDRAAAGTHLRWGVADPEDRVVGTVSLFRHHEESRRMELGYVLGRSAQGRGWATEAVGLALDWGFGAFGLHRVEADTDPRNARSCRLLERLGFTREGVLRERWIVAGEVSDTALYGILAREWRAR
jgi:RimJ/RimL family protein N-acetyltransferase